jgi:hypothetical protein
LSNRDDFNHPPEGNTALGQVILNKLGIKMTKPQIGSVGFYMPDPGFSKSPNMVLAIHKTKVTVFELPSKMTFNIDTADWGSIDQMEKDTLSVLNSPFDETTIQRLHERIRAISDAHRLLEGKLQKVLHLLNDAALSSGDIKGIDLPSEIKILLTCNPIITGACK